MLAWLRLARIWRSARNRMPRSPWTRCAINNLDRDLSRVLAVGAFAQIDGACAAMAEYRGELVVADDFAEQCAAAVARRCVERRTEGGR